MQKTKRREWVKTFAIIFLVVLLILTFFSQTIMNRSLPEVAAQYVESGTINAKIRGSGAVSADETYDVTISDLIDDILEDTGYRDELSAEEDDLLAKTGAEIPFADCFPAEEE